MNRRTPTAPAGPCQVTRDYGVATAAATVRTTADYRPSLVQRTAPTMDYVTGGHADAATTRALARWERDARTAGWTVHGRTDDIDHVDGVRVRMTFATTADGVTFYARTRRTLAPTP